MSDVIIRKDGQAGRITLNRPDALNALSWAMCGEIEKAFDRWRLDDDVAVVILDAEGERAFCAGGDLAEIYAAGRRGEFDYGARFWTDEYRMNAKIARYPKPVVSFLQGFTMGGGVGLGCHGSHRIVGESSRIAMPETGIGLVPDVGGSLLLAQAPGRLGFYLALTAARMAAGDAIEAGFADHYLPGGTWAAMKEELVRTGRVAPILEAAIEPEDRNIAVDRDWIDRIFTGDHLHDYVARLEADGSEAAGETLKAMRRNSPLAMAVAARLIGSHGKGTQIEEALAMEYRATSRASEHGDFLEGIRALIIDKDRNPRWRHDLHDVPEGEVEAFLAPLEAPLDLEGERV
ncbi:enoyl-CoA hydratase/isomerase family protein [Aestuariibius sp. 2305UL40-4]|uniref:enoyl-CoA hydratase/isomerase family protein n=1 Tax=Aestuariibius violaceus TaxID=3234132 RepID=UPI00345E38E6